MKYYRTIAVAIAAAFIAGASATEKQGIFPKKDGKNKAELVKENSSLRKELDSLKAELERYRLELAYADSVAAEMAPVFEEDTNAVLAPEDYTAEISDSLLNIWYAHKLASDESIEEYDMDSVRFKSDVPDEVYINRIKAMNSFITLPYNDIVKNYIILYSEKMPTKMSHILGLCEYYMPIFQETFNRYDMPEELKAMAVIESALNPLAVSRVGAKGMWQFMYNMAIHYGLKINSFVDERFDPVKSAEAAAKYLMDSYRIFGDWNLAIASYNCGAGNVNKAIRRSGGKREFWDIWPYLPRETRGYVPAFVGALYTMTYYKEHGLKPESVNMPVHVDTFKINKMLHLRQISELTGAPIEDLKNLNPQYRHEIIPGNEREYILRLPYNYTNAFIDCEDSVYRHKADVYFNPTTIKKIKDGGDGERIVYRVKSGDYLGRIASKYRVSVNQIKRWNNLKSNNIRVGQKLVIYRGGKAPVQTSSTASSAPKNTEQASGKVNSSVYTVKKGDVLSTIAERHHMTVAELKKLNGLQNNNIYAGQKLKVKGESVSASTQAAPTGSGNYTIYIVKSGDSLYSIAKNYPGVSDRNIMEFNGLSSSSIKPGMKLKIPTAN